MELVILYPSAGILAAAVVLDLLLGDPVYRAHPIRLIGHSITLLERPLRALGFDGYGGGITLCVLLTVFWCVAASALLLLAERYSHGAALLLHCYFLYSLLALRDLLDHGWAVESAARSNNLPQSRYATSRFVARDTAHLSFAGCRRAAIESVSENLTDGYVSPLFWYVVGGLPGIVLFKVFSSLDSRVGNKSERYIRFGWCAARGDDVLNWLTARITWILIALTAAFIPRCSAGKALAVGWQQHGVFTSPNSGWSEAATAGAIQRKLVGPIKMGGVLVTDLWLGDSGDPPAGDSAKDVSLAMTLATATGLAAATLSIGAIVLFW